MRCALSVLLLAAVVSAQGPKRKPRTVWKHEEAAAITHVAVSGNNVVYVVKAQGLVCRSARDGRELFYRFRWKRVAVADKTGQQNIHDRVPVRGVRTGGKGQ